MAEQTINISSTRYFGSTVNQNIEWESSRDINLGVVIAALTAGNQASDLRGLQVNASGDFVQLRIQSGRELSSLFETSGSFTIAVGSLSLTVLMADFDDDTNWYNLFGVPGAGNFVRDVLALPDPPHAAILTLRDFAPAAPAFKGAFGTNELVGAALGTVELTGGAFGTQELK